MQFASIYTGKREREKKMHRKREKEEKKPMSVLEGDEKFLEKILSRKSSAGDHGNVSQHFRVAGEVPFLWESMPGTPQNPSSGEDMIITRARLKHEGYEEEEEEEEEADIIRAVMRPPPVNVGRRNKKLPMPFRSRFWKKNLLSRIKKFHLENEEKNNNNHRNSDFDDNNESFKLSNSDDAHSYRPSAASNSSNSSSSSSSFLAFADDHHDAMCTHHHQHHHRTSKAWLERFICKSGI